MNIQNAPDHDNDESSKNNHDRMSHYSARFATAFENILVTYTNKKKVTRRHHLAILSIVFVAAMIVLTIFKAPSETMWITFGGLLVLALAGFKDEI